MAKRAKTRTVKTRSDSFLAPERLYTRDGFMEAAGLSRTRLSDARHDYGLWPNFLTVGQRQFIRGADAIEFILSLSKAMADEKASDELT